ncbi:MAG: twin-arginine translocation signal domain-containing protein [Halobacteriales archaeon]|nr:twin-arginine translocation signal domain-containing protein [Halobacteriales archaeon]
MKENGRNKTRRDVIKSAGIAGAVLATGSGVSSAQSNGQPSYQELIEESQRILETRGMDARDEFLANRGFSNSRQTITVGDPTSSDDEPTVSPQQVDCIDPTNCDGDISLSLGISYYRYSNVYYVDLSARFRYEWYPVGVSDNYYGPETPADGFGLTWERDHFQLSNYEPGSTSPANVMSEGSFVDWDNGSWNREGTGFTLDDRGLCKDTGTTGGSRFSSSKQWSNWTSGGVTLDLGPDWTGGDTIRGLYSYTWNESNTNVSVSVGYPRTISVTASSSEKMEQETLQTDIDGIQLADTINQS